MAHQFQFELVSPEKLVASTKAVMVTVPGGEGDYGVLAGHAPLITTVRPGVINIYAQDEATISESIFVAGGFAEVTAERCTVLAEEATPVGQLNRAEIEGRLKELSDNLAAASTDAERAFAEKRLDVTKAQLQAVSQH